MTWGFEIKNASGAVVVDDVYPQMHKIEGGSAASTAFARGFTGFVSFSRSITNPVLFIRCAINCYFAIGVISATGFTYTSAAALDWIVFEGAPAAHVTSGYGLVVYGSAGEVLFDASKSFPVITQQSVAMTSGDTADLKGVDEVLRTITHSTTAFDGGYPYVSAVTFMQSHYWVGSGGAFAHNVCGRFLSTTSLEISVKVCANAGSGNPNFITNFFRSGQKPRDVLFSK